MADDYCFSREHNKLRISRDVDDYSLLKHLKLKVDREDGAFSFCSWIYLFNCPRFPCTIIRQIQGLAEGNLPFLILNKDKKLRLFPLFFLHEEALTIDKSVACSEVTCTSADFEFPFRKWVHVGCEVSSNFIRLHINGVLMREKTLSPLLTNGSALKDLRGITFAAADENVERVDGYVHCVQILPQKFSIKDQLLKNPPIELSIDSSCISDIDEGADGIWSIVGGKASCRRNFNLDVILLDALGHPVNREMEIVASLLYADNGAPVEKPHDAEAPLLTSYDGIEFASFVRPSKLLHGRASFKLKIAQLSSKCENRLFRVRFDSPRTREFPFLEAYSNPIRCISRSRSTRLSSIMPKKLITVTHSLDRPHSLGVNDGSSEAQHGNGGGHLPILSIRESKSNPPTKRGKVGTEKSFARIQANRALDQPYDGCSSHSPNTNQGGDAVGVNVEGKAENLEGTDNTSCDSESVESRDPAVNITNTGNPISDLTIFRYCLGGTHERSLLLRGVTTYATDEEMVNFAQQVALYTGCSHHRYQISIAKRLLMEGTDAWDLISHGKTEVLWENAVLEIEKQFMKISRCSTRTFKEQDFQLLQSIGGCEEYMTREHFDKMWHWLYPVAFTLSRDWINAIWESTLPRWLEGLITKEEAESSLRSPRGLQDPGTFILRFPTSRSWPHPDAGSLIATYVGADYTLHHRLLSLDYSCSNREMNHKSLQDLLLTEPELTRLGRVTR